MPVAAVPAYLGSDFQDASPGLRFGMYLALWGVNRRTEKLLWSTHDIDYQVRGQERQESEIKEENKVGALAGSTTLSQRDKALIKSLATRIRRVAQTMPPGQLLALQAQATAPFTTGLGNEHPLENGFAFLNPYGLPYLAGSGVKGVLRRAAQELASGDWGDTSGWSNEPIATITIDKKRVPLSPIDLLFGCESASGDTDHLRGVLTFWDVIPEIKSNNLLVEIMTPHQSHYYQQKCERKSGDNATPHDSGQPNPISFLTVPPGSGFTFHVVCDEARLKRLAPELREGQDGIPRWKTLMTAAFEHAFRWLGFGAKTAVGYGAMQRDTAAEKKAAETAAQAQAEAQRATRLAMLTPNLRQVEEFRAAMRRRFGELNGAKEKANTGSHQSAQQLAKDAATDAWSAEEKRAAADAIAEWLPKIVAVDMKDERKKLKLAALRGET